MYSEIPLYLALIFTLAGLALLAWSSDVFVDSASTVAKALGVSPFVIGMVIIGFGTSAPEFCVSVMSGVSGHSELSLGNAYGSCIFNVAVIIAIAALIKPIVVKPTVCYIACSLLVLISLFSYVLLSDGFYSRADAVSQLVVFALVLPAYCWIDQSNSVVKVNKRTHVYSRKRIMLSWFWLAVGLTVLILSSHFLVWGAVDLARTVGINELVIGLTIIAVGTSLPELASAVASARRGESEFVLGNIVGSNIFNILAIVGVAGSLTPIRDFSEFVVKRDIFVMMALSLSLIFFGANWKGFKKDGVINRYESILFLIVYLLYTAFMLIQEAT
jgi:cation:H+ antiporter